MTRPIAHTAYLAFTALLALAVTLLAVPAAQADKGGRCHIHGNKPASQAVVTDGADQRKAALVKAGKLDPSWQAIQQDKAELVDGKKGKEWKITFNHPAAPDPGKRTLYLFFSPPGNFIAANHTGK